MLPGGFEVRDERLVELAAALIKSAPDVIVAGPERPLRALQAATRTVPLIGMSEDLVAEGLVASLARPGGNITGISLLSPELDGKRQDILIEAVPRIRPNRGNGQFQGHSAIPPSDVAAWRASARR